MFCRFFIYEKSERVFGKRTVSLRKKFIVKNMTVNSATSVKCKRLRLFHAKNVVDCIVRKSKSPQQECRRVRILSRRPRPTELMVLLFQEQALLECHRLCGKPTSLPSKAPI